MADWRWEPFQDDLQEGLPEAARAETERLANEIAVRESMVYLEGAAYTGPGPGVRTESRGLLMLEYLTDVRGERIVVVQVSWFG
ncbi:hypothetical protein [Streptomyces poonensis]|uniref:Uncharacterized protein n=1 Tax=Streptomyces poonensis TaxID=68255 RepID=A0A918PPV5_9ACTN|nr:hypothetical protein [Streptomyces poonensis]GGZ18042.1 hypothetical protein GCM10010365_42690 [Streptomyces poonensis]GLJ91049.1 hypothetical protein GCM10017589_36550 [Streptomyces poonensis]